MIKVIVNRIQRAAFGGIFASPQSMSGPAKAYVRWWAAASAVSADGTLMDIASRPIISAVVPSCAAHSAVTFVRPAIDCGRRIDCCCSNLNDRTQRRATF